MIDENDHEIKNLFLDIIHYCGDLQGAYNRVDKERYSTIVKFIYRQTIDRSTDNQIIRMMASITIDGAPVILMQHYCKNVLMLEESRLALKEKLMSEIFISGVISAKEKLELLNKQQ